MDKIEANSTSTKKQKKSKPRKKISNVPENPPKVIVAPPEIGSCAVSHSKTNRETQSPADFYCSNGHDEECQGRIQNGLWLPCEAPYDSEVARVGDLEAARKLVGFRYILQLGQAFTILSIAYEKRRIKGYPKIVHNIDLYLELLRAGQRYPVRIIALLHDIFDPALAGERYTPRFKPRDLKAMQFDPDILEGLFAFTRREDEKFEDYYAKMRENKLATIVAYYDARLHVRKYKWGERRNYREITDRLQKKFG